MVKMDLKFIKTSNRSSFLSIKLLLNSGFQISFPMFLNNLLCKKTSYCYCNRHLMFFMSGVWHITVEWKIIDKFSKILYQKNENVLWKARYIKVSIIFILVWWHYPWLFCYLYCDVCIIYQNKIYITKKNPVICHTPDIKTLNVDCNCSRKFFCRVNYWETWGN